MLSFFRNNNLSASFLVFIYGIPFFLLHFFFGMTKVEAYEELPFLLNFIPKSISNSFFFRESLFVVSAYIIAFWINRLVNYNRLGKKNTYITAVTFFISLFVLPDSDVFSTALFAGMFILGMVDQLFLAYERKTSVVEVFNAAMFNAIAVLIYPPAIFLVLFFMISWFVLRTFNPREFVILLSGLLIPFYLVATYLYVNERLNNWISMDYVGKYGFSNFSFSNNLAFWIGVLNVVIITIFSIFNLNNLKTKTTIREQKFINVLFYFYLFSFSMLFFQKEYNGAHLIMTTIPMGIFLSLNLQAIKNERLAEILHFLLLASTLFVQYKQFN